MKTTASFALNPFAFATLAAALAFASAGAGALTVDGVSAEWEKVGHPWAASKIAACPQGVIYALNNDHTLWKGNGTDGGWSYRGHPSAAADIACSSPEWIWALNSDKKFYYNTHSGNDSTWVYEGTASYAQQIGSGSLLSALNYDDKVYTYDNYKKVWSYKGTYPNATEAASAGNHWFPVTGGNVQLPTTSFLVSFPITVNGTQQNVRDVSAPYPNVVWALTEARDLYRATIKEAACKDGKDNDGDSLPDGYDSDCHAPLGAELCNQVAKSGSFCLSRLGAGSNALAVCNGPTLVSTQEGDYCIQVGTGGSDYVNWIR